MLGGLDLALLYAVPDFVGIARYRAINCCQRALGIPGLRENDGTQAQQFRIFLQRLPGSVELCESKIVSLFDDPSLGQQPGNVTPSTPVPTE